MENRIPHHLKGKGIAKGYSPPPRKRIRAPDLDTSELIEENSLTLISRLTNPSAQRLWSLFPFLSNRWNLKRKAKWEPIISDSFPSKIPFWIEIQGLPKHFWQTAMLQTIGEELGEVITSEITTSSAKLRVLIDGLQPLTKETYVDFPGGSEAIIYLEYKSLKNHCLHCNRLTHERKDCPGLAAGTERTSNNSLPDPSSGPKTTHRNYYTPRDNFIAPRDNLTHSGRREQSLSGNFDSKGSYQRDRDNYPPRHLTPRRTRERSREQTASKEFDSHYHRRVSSTSQQQHLQWTEKSHSRIVSHHELFDSSRTRRPPLERDHNLYLPQSSPPPPLTQPTRRRLSSVEIASPPPPIPSKEQVMSDLREVTIQYTTCADPTESAARKQRVLQGEAKNLMNDTVNLIIQAAATASAQSLHAHQTDQSNPQIEGRVTVSEVQPSSSDPKDKPAKRGRGRPPLAKSAMKSTVKLAGAKSQKRNLTSGSPKKNGGQKNSPQLGRSQAGPSSSKPAPTQTNSQTKGLTGKTSSHKNAKTTNPQITLIPAMKKKMLVIYIGRDLLKPHLGKLLGTGDNTPIWKEPWLSLSVPLTPIGPATEESQHLLVSHLRHPITLDWNHEKIRQIIPNHEQDIKLLRPSTQGGSDKWAWLPTPSGIYTVKSGSILEAACCTHCEADEETLCHLFFTCPFSKKVWENAPCKASLDTNQLSTFRTGFEASKLLTCLPPTGLGDGPISPWIFWSIWTTRNKKLFNDRLLQPMDVITQAIT
ncbi:unnamed protein product, partial [Arabidopsis halleri]